MPEWYEDHKLMINKGSPSPAGVAGLPIRDMTCPANSPARFGAAARAFAAGAMALLAALAGPAAPAAAQGRGVPIVRDAEIEALVRDYVAPILKVAGLARAGIEVVLVNDRSFNAFVVGRRLFINTGALMQAETPNEIIGVLAHETGHLAGGHQQRLREQLERAQTMAIVAGLLGAGAVVAGAATRTEGMAQAGMGLVTGGGEAARRSILGYQRTEEYTADRSAIQYLNATGQSAKGMLDTFERLQGALTLSGARIDPYQVSHPLPRDRIANLEQLAKASPHYGKADSPELQSRHDLMRAKIAAYTGGQGDVARLFRKRPAPLATQYGDALVNFLHGNPRTALAKIDALIKAQPRNPYFQEARGDVLIKLNRAKEAADAYARAVKLDPHRSGLLQVGYGQALLAIGTPAAAKQATDVLERGLAKEKEYASGYRFLAQAYGQLGDVGSAELATAEGYYYSGAYNQSKIFAMRAQQKLKQGSPDWLRAQDIINVRQPGARKKK